MKICDLTQFYSPVSGGVRRYIEQKVAVMRRQRPDCRHVLVVPGETTSRTGDELARVYTIASPLVSRTSRYRMLLKLHLVEEVLEREKPDIIESGDPYQLAWKAIASGQGLGIPVVGFYHSHFPEALLRSVEKYASKAILAIVQEASRRYVEALYNQFKTTFVPSPALSEVLASWGVEHVESIDLGVDTTIFHPSQACPLSVRRELGVPEGKTVLLYVGRLAPEKNVRTLFDAFRILTAASRDYHLVVVGDGTWRGALKKLTLETQSVSWTPYCSEPAKLADIYRSADLFVHPGIQETFGLVTLESQACGTPVVGIRGSYMDRINFSEQFRWAAENSAASLAAAIAANVSDDLHQRGLDASRVVCRQFSWENVFSKIFGIYENVISE